jgi:hypothetical protein
MIPVAGSAYTYTYATLGEWIAWIIGWDLVIEYAIDGFFTGQSAHYRNVPSRHRENEEDLLLADHLGNELRVRRIVAGL